MLRGRRKNRRQNAISQRDDRPDTMGTNVYSSKDDQSMHNSLNGEFILYQILIERLLDEKKELPNVPPSLYEYFEPEDKTDKDVLKEFDREYQPTKAINWYTRETCVYKTLNKALRTQNIDDVIAFTKLVRGLRAQLGEEQKKFAKTQKYPLITVYRGQLISKDEINRLKSSPGQLISMNSFLSTSTNRKKAVEFATSRPPPNDELTTVLLEINADINNPSRPLADIKHLSAFSEEEEILFMFGAIFRLDDVRFDKDLKLWQVQLTMCNDEDPDLKDFLSSINQKLDGQNKLISLGTYLVQMQKYEDAQEHYEKILENNLVDDPIDLAYCHHGLALVNHKKMNCKSAIQNFDKALDYLEKNSPKKDHVLISQCYNDLAKVYLEENNLTLSFHYYEKALRTKTNITSTTLSGLSQLHFKLENYTLSLQYLQRALERQPADAHEFIASNFIDMGKVYAALNEKEKASEMFNKAIAYQTKILGKEHPDLSYTYNALGLMFSKLDDEKKAFEFIEKAYQLQSQTLPSNHSDFAETFTNFGDLYMRKGDFDKALSYYNKALENQLKSFLWNHPGVAKAYETIGQLYWKKKDYKQALIYFQKILDSELSRKRLGDLTLSKAYKDLADLYFESNDIDKALEFYLKFLHNELQTKLHQDMSLAETYKIIANIYSGKRILSQSLVYWNRLLDCHLQTRPYDESAVAKAYTMIGEVYLKKRHFDESLLYYDTVKIKFSNKKVSEDPLLNTNEMENVDNIHFERRHLDQVLNYFEKYFNQKSKISPKIDLSSDDICNILANICFEKKDYDKSLNYFLNLLEKKLKKKPLDDYSLCNIYKAIGTMYFKKNILNKALFYFNRLLDSQFQRTKSFDHPSIIETYNLIGKIYLTKHNFIETSNYLNKLMETTNISNSTDVHFEQRHLDESLAYFHKLFYKERQNISTKLFSLEELSTIIGNIYLEKQDSEKALKYFHELLNYQLNRNPIGDISSANTYWIIANIYMNSMYSNYALRYYQQALSIYQRNNPINYLVIRTLKEQIRRILLPNV
jgi:tetratricopeptide (TPR) repeat protein